MLYEAVKDGFFSGQNEMWTSTDMHVMSTAAVDCSIRGGSEMGAIVIVPRRTCFL